MICVLLLCASLVQGEIIYQSSGNKESVSHTKTNELNYRIGTDVEKKPEFTPSKENIPQNCTDIGYCETMPYYPKDYVKEILDQKNKQRFKRHDYLKPGLQRRSSEDLEELCGINEKIVTPLAATDKDGVWYYVINVNDSKESVQTFLAETCKYPKCNRKHFQPVKRSQTYSCQQKYILRSMFVLDHDGTVTQKSMKLPCCCSCVFN